MSKSAMSESALPKPALLLSGLLLILTACGGADAPDAGKAPAAAATPHGYVAGAQESAEPQTGLLTLDRKTGDAQLLSLLTEETVEAGSFGPIDSVARDGRYAFLTTGAGVEVFDTGAWTVPHGDHSHYYSSDPKAVGTIDLPDAGAVAGDGENVAVFSHAGGYASIYTHDDLDVGEIKESGRITTNAHDGVVVPFEGHFVASVSAGGPEASGVEVRNGADGTVLAEAGCPGLSAHARTRVGVVFACTDGALLITEDDGSIEAAHIAYPEEAPAEPATVLAHRPGSNELAGPAGESGLWHLNVSERRWTFLKTPVPALTASAVGDGKRVLAVGVDGSLLVLDPTTGSLLARAAILEPLPDDAAEPQLEIDTARAYVSDPTTSTIHEVDYRDGLRIARTFDVPSADLMLETGL